jgi:hypothetical protein
VGQEQRQLVCRARADLARPEISPRSVVSRSGVGFGGWGLCCVVRAPREWSALAGARGSGTGRGEVQDLRGRTCMRDASKVCKHPSPAQS